jgi:hypothetical protein
MDAETMLADVRDHLTPSSDGFVAAEYDAAIKELFDLRCLDEICEGIC